MIDGSPHLGGAVSAEVAGDLAAAHRVPGQVRLAQVQRGEELVQVGGEGVVVVPGGWAGWTCRSRAGHR